MKNENGKTEAFPCVGYGMEGNSWYQAGLTKREYFAAMAMQGIVTSIDSEENYLRLKAHANTTGLNVSQWIARDAVKQADALLAELEKQIN